MIIGKVCRFYGWTAEQCLKMPASRFFVMYQAIDRLRGKELAQACYVSRSAHMDNEAFAECVQIFENTGETPVRPPDIDIPSVQKKPTLTKEQQKESVFSMFGSDHRVSRKVMRAP